MQKIKDYIDGTLKVYRPDEEQDFLDLKPGDMIIVKWSDYYVEHTQGAKKVMAYNIHYVKRNEGEVICKKKHNHYFNYRMYLEDKSVAEEVLIIYSDDEQ